MRILKCDKIFIQLKATFQIHIHNKHIRKTRFFIDKITAKSRNEDGTK